MLQARGTSLDAVTRAVMVLEDNPLFNAGRGSVFTHDGRNELDAAIMDGRTLRAGAVCGLTHIKNPIDLARAVMEHSEYVMLSGAGAEEFALSRGVALVPHSYFHTPERWRQLERVRSGDAGLSALTISHVGTVGAVALDDDGRLAAATSTGGMTGKRYQPHRRFAHHRRRYLCGRPLLRRVGHRPWGNIHSRRRRARYLRAHALRRPHACAMRCAKSCSRNSRRCTARAASSRSIRSGEIAMEFNSEGMFRASRRSGEEPRIAIYRP